MEAFQRFQRKGKVLPPPEPDNRPLRTRRKNLGRRPYAPAPTRSMIAIVSILVCLLMEAVGVGKWSIDLRL
jgi:hypothetical protein